MVPLEKLGDPPAWIQRKLLEDKLAAGTAVPTDHSIVPDFDRHVGNLSFPVTSALYQDRLEEGPVGTDADRTRINIETGSSLYANGRKWISVDAPDLFKLQNLVVQLSTELFDFQPSLF